MFYQSHRFQKTKKSSVSRTLFQRRGWDSNPRALSDKRFSRPPRYDHFDTSPTIYLSAASVSPQRQDVFYHSFLLSSILFFNFFIFLYFSYFPVFLYINTVLYKDLFTDSGQLFICSIKPFAVSISSGVVILILQ